MSKCDHKVNFVSIVSFVLSAAMTLAQGTMLIGPSTRNGSFEDGVASPWRDVQAINGPLFASDGSWYGVSQDTANGQTARAGASQILSADSSLPANPANGLIFILTFDARNGAVGFDTVYGYINAWNADGTAVRPSANSITSPPLASSGWVAYETVFQFPETWDGGGNFIVGIQFTKQGAVIATTYTGYLDNIVLQQIPEPSSLALLGCGGLLLAGRLLRRFFTTRLRLPCSQSPAPRKSRCSRAAICSGS